MGYTNMDRCEWWELTVAGEISVLRVERGVVVQVDGTAKWANHVKLEVIKAHEEAGKLQLRKLE